MASDGNNKTSVTDLQRLLLEFVVRIAGKLPEARGKVKQKQVDPALAKSKHEREAAAREREAAVREREAAALERSAAQKEREEAAQQRALAAKILEEQAATTEEEVRKAVEEAKEKAEAEEAARQQAAEERAEVREAWSLLIAFLHGFIQGVFPVGAPAGGIALSAFQDGEWARAYSQRFTELLRSLKRAVPKGAWQPQLMQQALHKAGKFMGKRFRQLILKVIAAAGRYAHLTLQRLSLQPTNSSSEDIPQPPVEQLDIHVRREDSVEPTSHGRQLEVHVANDDGLQPPRQLQEIHIANPDVAEQITPAHQDDVRSPGQQQEMPIASLHGFQPTDHRDITDLLSSNHDQQPGAQGAGRCNTCNVQFDTLD